MTQIEIFGFSQSTYVQTAKLAAAEKGVSHRLLPLEFGAESHRALHPFAKMPAMRHGKAQLFETAAICVYLDEAFEGPQLQPATPLERAVMWQWISASVDYIYGSLVRSHLGEDKPTPAEAETLARCLDLLDAALAGQPWLAGKTLSLADLFVAPMLGFYAGSVDGAKTELAARPALRGWLDRMNSRDSFRTLEAA